MQSRTKIQSAAYMYGETSLLLIYMTIAVIQQIPLTSNKPTPPLCNTSPTALQPWKRTALISPTDQFRVYINVRIGYIELRKHRQQSLDSYEGHSLWLSSSRMIFVSCSSSPPSPSCCCAESVSGGVVDVVAAAAEVKKVANTPPPSA